MNVAGGRGRGARGARGERGKGREARGERGEGREARGERGEGREARGNVGAQQRCARTGSGGKREGEARRRGAAALRPTTVDGRAGAVARR